MTLSVLIIDCFNLKRSRKCKETFLTFFFGNCTFQRNKYNKLIVENTELEENCNGFQFSQSRGKIATNCTHTHFISLSIKLFAIKFKCFKVCARFNVNKNR